MAQKENPVSRLIVEDSDGEKKGELHSNSSSDGGEDDSDAEAVGDEEEVEDDDDEEVEDDDEEEVEDDDEEVEDDDEEVVEDDDEEVEDDDEEVEDDDEDDLKEVEDEDEEFSSKESIRKLLEPFGKEKLVELVKEAVLKNSCLLPRVLGASESDPDYRKVFVHGLASDATSEAVAAVFSPFGQIEDCTAILNYETGRCKGYAFVLFKSRAAATRALKNPLKQIGSRTTNCHLASSGSQVDRRKDSSEASDRKIIVNNVSDKVNTDGIHTRAVSSLQVNNLTPNYTSGATLLGQNLGPGPKTLMGQNLGFGTTMLSGQNFGPVPTTLMGQNIGPGLTSSVGKNGGFGYFNPTAGLYPALSIGGGAQPYGIVSANRDSGLGLNSMSQSASNFGTLSALHGLGAHHNSTLTKTLKPQSGAGSLGTSRLPTFFRQ